MSDFNAQVYRLVNQVPPGRVVTYGQVARALGKVRGARAVGWALSAAPEGACPWQRVINSQGRVSPRENADRQRHLLEAEGVIFEDGVVDLNRFGWEFSGSPLSAGSFADHFSAGADSYARFRPRYPDQLFLWLADLCPQQRRVWDCGTGNGQAAVALAEHFVEVIATEPSAAQLARAEQHPRVAYIEGAAEQSPLESDSVDLITVAQAYHWFDHARFLEEARRVAREGAHLAVWSYALCRISDEIDALVDEFYFEEVGEFWPPERRHVEQGYAELPFPPEVKAPSFEMTAEWDLEHFVGYLSSWSAVKRFRESRGQDPIPGVKRRLAEVWNGPRSVIWPLKVRVGSL